MRTDDIILTMAPNPSHTDPVEAGGLKIHQTFWRTDFSAVDPQARRAARYALQLLHGNKGFMDELRGDSPLDGVKKPMWRVVAPLLRLDALEAAFSAESETASTMRMEDRLDAWRLAILTDLPAGLLARLATDDGETPVETCIGVLIGALNLSDTEGRVLDFLSLREFHPPFRMLLDQTDQAPQQANLDRLSAMLGCNSSRLLRSSISTLVKMRLAEYTTRHFVDMENVIVPDDGLLRILVEGPNTEQALMDMLIETATEPEWSLADFPHLFQAAARLTAVLRRAAALGEPGVNALFFGPPGTGKTQFAQAVARAAGLRLYRVRADDDDGEEAGRQGRLLAYLIAQRLLRQQRDALLLFDEVEDVFEGGGGELRKLFGGDRPAGRDKGWMNRTLEENPVPAIWISNDVSVMDPAFLRRYLLPVEFAIPPRAVRRAMAERHLGDCRLPAHLLEELAADDKLAPAQYGAARKLLTLHGAEADPAHAEGIVRTGVAAMRRLLHGSGLPAMRRSPTKFDIDLLNIAGGIAPATVVRALERQGRGRLCFFGPPGTGKTEFAHVLAEALGRELVVRRSSDLVSKYVGETEQNLARLFNTLDAERSLLFIDEVDGFLRDRRQAQHSWEVTAVNELLQHMEGFPGIFIAATNLAEGLDPAALRRFDFKLHFRPLAPAQRAALFAAEVLGDKSRAGDLPPAILNRLAGLGQLTAGDFANVCRQRDLLGETLAAEEFLRRLIQECRWKAVTEESQ